MVALYPNVATPQKEPLWEVFFIWEVFFVGCGWKVRDKTVGRAEKWDMQGEERAPGHRPTQPGGGMAWTWKKEPQATVPPSLGEGRRPEVRFLTLEHSDVPRRRQLLRETEFLVLS